MFNIRPAVPEDAKGIAMLINNLFKEIDHRMPDFGESQIENLYKNELKERLIIFLAEDENKNCSGVITVTEGVALYTKGRFGVINELYILPEYRSEGLGKLLIEEVKKNARKKGWTRIEVTTPDRSHWKRTVDFYEREGFIEIGPRLKFEF